MNRFARLTDEFLRKMENHAATEAIGLRKRNSGRLRLIGIAIGIVVVTLVALLDGVSSVGRYRGSPLLVLRLCAPRFNQAVAINHGLTIGIIPILGCRHFEIRA